MDKRRKANVVAIQTARLKRVQQVNPTERWNHIRNLLGIPTQQTPIPALKRNPDETRRGHRRLMSHFRKMRRRMILGGPGNHRWLADLTSRPRWGSERDLDLKEKLGLFNLPERKRKLPVQTGKTWRQTLQ